MATDYPQTDTVAPLGVIQACAPVAPAGDSDAIQATVGGTAGGTELACAVASQSSELCFAIEVDISDDTSLDSGSSSIPINVTTAQNNLTLESVYVCRVNSSGTSQETLASETNIGLDISAGGVFTRTPTLSAASAHNAGDKVYIGFIFANSNQHTSRTVSITPDQTVTMPFSVAGTTESITGTAAGTSSDTAVQTDTSSLSATGAGTSTDSAPIVATAALTVTGAGTSTDTAAVAATASLTATGAGASTDTIAAATIAESISGTSAGTSSDSADAGVEPPIRVLTVRFRPAGWAPA